MNAILNIAVLLAVAALSYAQVDVAADLLVPKQASSRNGIQDQNSAETGFGGGGGGGIENSKYFHYQHLPEHDKYEFGYRRGNDHHVRERYEKAVPHEGHFKTKVRWADHKGGHGEHYWDYNHAGHGGDGDGEGSDPVPIYTDSQNANSNTQPRIYPTRQSDQEASRRQFNQEPVYNPPVRANSDDHAGFVKSFEDEIAGVDTFEIHREGVKQKRNPAPVVIKKPVEPVVEKERSPVVQKRSAPQLFFDLETGKVIDEATGKTYLLSPVEN